MRRRGHVLRKRYGHAKSARPATVPRFGGGGEIVITPRMWDHFYSEARKEVAWAKRVSREPDWRNQMSGISVEAALKALNRSLEQLTTGSIQYAELRSTAEDSFGRPIDMPARALWLKLGGKIPHRAVAGLRRRGG